MRKIILSKKCSITILITLVFFITSTPGLAFNNEQHSGNSPPSPPPESREELVILLHGALKSASSLNRMEKAFQNEGYRTFNWDYNSRDYTVEENAAKLDSIIHKRGYTQYVLHFVTHSMGGIVIRYYLDLYDVPDLGRFVMIAPPNQGSRIATEFRDFPPFRWLYKKNVDYLVTGADAFAPNAGIPTCEFGIIAGGTGGKYGYTWYLPGDDDSVISVEQTRLKGSTDFILLHHIHATIMMEKDTIRQTLHFIEHGNFDHAQRKDQSDATSHAIEQSEKNLTLNVNFNHLKETQENL